MTGVWVGIDVGTSGARALAVDARGAVAGAGARPLRSRRDGARHEQDPDAWWQAAAGACRAALHAATPARVHGVATCATSGTVVVVDRASGAPLTPGVMYDDARAAGVPAKLRALLDGEPALAARGRLAHQADVVTRALAGHDVAADWSHALKSGYDVAQRAWRAAGVPGALLPDVVAPGSVLGEVCPSAARAAGLPAGTPIVAGMTDGCAAQIATGALRPGDWCAVLGTTLVLKGVARAPVEDPAGVLYSHRLPDGDWLPGGASNCGAGAFPDGDLDALERAAARHGFTSVLAYPLVGRGERFPFAAPDAEPFVAGDPDGEGERFLALLQGLAFVVRLCFETLDGLGAPTGGAVTLAGGASRNALLCRLVATALEQPVRLVERGESAFGMALLAAAATTRRELADVAAQFVRPGASFEPRRDERLEQGYRAFVAELRARDWLR